MSAGGERQLLQQHCLGNEESLGGELELHPSRTPALCRHVGGLAPQHPNESQVRTQAMLCC